MFFVETKSLPICLISALESVGFRRDSIEVCAAETWTAQEVCAYTANRAHVVAVNLSTGERVATTGAWGGANGFEARQADHDDRDRPLVPGFVVIKGESGGKGAFFKLYAHPETVAKQLSADTQSLELTEVEQNALNAICAYNSKGRAEHFRRCTYDVESTLNALAQKGLVQRNKAGATKVTTAGRNARIGRYDCPNPI